MKKLALSLTFLLLAAASLFAQADLQVLAIVKYNKSEPITVKQLKSRVNVYQKQTKNPLTLEQKHMVLDNLIEERLMYQAAQKAGITIPDSYVDQYFAQGLSQSVGAAVTEKQLAEIVQKTQGITLDELLIRDVGMNAVDYKNYLKTQLMIQQYVVQQNQAALQKVAATDEEIRSAYQSQKSQFVWNDMMKVLLVVVPKENDAEAAKLKLNDFLNKYKDKKLTAEQIALQSETEGSGYQAGEIIVPMNEQSANGIGMTFANLQVLFNQNEGFISDINETEKDFRFIAILKKYNAKLLDLFDIYQPDSTITVYEYVRTLITQQKQMQYVQKAAQDLSKSLNTAENVEMKKTGAALDKLLEWGE
ncbi:MAG: peptidyl-prolyl cis-trans isomerase [Treponema sp.]|nr:peptidyl-prolyl cis-trans isomerase [Treponema sp.]